MKLVYLSLLVLPAFCQTQPPATDPGAVPPQEPVAEQPKTPKEANRSVVDVKPGEKAIKNKDLWNESGVFHPFMRMPKFVIRDQVAIWTSPFHTSKADAKWWLIWGGATTALVATDKWTVKQLPNTSGQRRIGTYTSNIGAAYSLVPISASFYFIGSAFKSDKGQRFRETGLLGFETLIDTTIVETVIKAATHRARPLEGDGKGHFWDSSGSTWNASFPSGHAINTFALASIFAHQYHDVIIVPITAYSLAGLVVGARIAAQKHFPGDVLAGAAMGWFIGDYVYGKRHNPDLDEKKPISWKIMDHFRIGAAYPVGPAAICEVPTGYVPLPSASAMPTSSWQIAGRSAN
jgi:membrane-associated phospholipid phosphatase